MYIETEVLEKTIKLDFCTYNEITKEVFDKEGRFIGYGIHDKKKKELIISDQWEKKQS